MLVREIKSARQKAGMSQQQVADQLGVPQSFVAKIELGERRIDVVEFLRVMKVVNGSWKEVLKRVEAETS
ncbi:helix-turn-helix transcriptional regulator [Hyphomonas sp.]|uniref:helix-turn-helix domain-containing protein n=1 Tax=Hyphomonas sp. TaxID=87 RepID=UPI00345578F2